MQPSRSKHPVAIALAVCAALLATGCTGNDEQAPEPATLESQSPTASDMPGLADPDTTAAAVWGYVQARQYASDWSMWPGKIPFYPGTEPHGALLTTYLNDVARDAVTNGATSLPPGSIIVKENYRPESTLAATTIMYKFAGYDPAHDDWFWLKRMPTGEVEASGRIESCQTCHGESETDFIKTQTLGTMAAVDSADGS